MDQENRVQDLTKTCADKAAALKRITLRLQAGEFFGFPGPNGAGKPTTITLLDKDSGEISVLTLFLAARPFGRRVSQPGRARRSIALRTLGGRVAPPLSFLDPSRGKVYS